MRKYLCAFAFAILAGGLLGSSVFADETLVRFKGGIGVIPVSNVLVNAVTGAITVNRNVVRGVNPAGQIWVIRELKADVKVDGRIKVDGRGLLLGGGNNIGSNSDASVFATLICGTAAPTLHSSDLAGVALEPNGDFRIDDDLDIVPPNPCASPVLLIRNASNLGWFAAGIPKLQ